MKLGHRVFAAIIIFGMTLGSVGCMIDASTDSKCCRKKGCDDECVERIAQRVVELQRQQGQIMIAPPENKTGSEPVPPPKSCQ